jgi:hypothetical protein
MQIRVVASCAAITCAGVSLGSVASCVSSSNPSGPTGNDASFPIEDGSQPSVDSSPSPGTDAGADAALLPDAAPANDSGSDAADANPCFPTSITGFVVPPYIPAAGGGSAVLDCNTGESVALGADCFSDASTPATCAGFADSGSEGGAVSALCLGCLYSPEGSDAGYGPIIQAPVPLINVGGCVELNDLSDAGHTCAQAIQAAWECEEFACKTGCPVTDTASGAAYVACTNLAATGVCSAYASAAQSCLALEQADAGAPTPVQMNCFDGTTPLLEYFCGS